MKIRVFEVGPRDGLQNEKQVVSTSAKLKWIEGLVAAGLKDIEIGAFVKADRVPQMADSAAIFTAWTRGQLKTQNARAWALVPNLMGLELAQHCGVQSVGLFTAATETFNRRNIGMSIQESLQEIEAIVQAARKSKIKIRGYVSTAFGCPFEGPTPAKKALRVIEKLVEMGIPEISIGDTIGVADPAGVSRLIKPALKNFGAKRLAVHFHDTRGTALANTLRAMDLGIRTVDSSAGGMGGCPFAPGASGNLPTEDLIYMLDGMGIQSGVDLNRLTRTSLDFAKKIGRPLTSRYLQAASRSKSKLGS